MTVRTLAVIVVLLSPAVARAQPANDVARADALFSAAKQLRDAGLYADACPGFAESNRLAPGVGVSLYLADCYERTGRTASAWAEFRNAEKLARERNDNRADLAHTRAQVLEPKLSGLTISVPPALAQSGPQVLLDGSRAIPPEEWNVAMAVDPGDHVVTVNMPGQAPRTFTAHVAAGSRAATLNVDGVGAEGAAPAPVEAPAPLPTVSSPPPDPGATKRWIGMGLLGAGAVGIGLGTVFILNKGQTSSASGCTPTSQDNTATTGAAIAYVAGGLALAAGLVLTVTNHNNTSVGVVAAPVLMAGGGGALVRGTF